MKALPFTLSLLLATGLAAFAQETAEPKVVTPTPIPSDAIVLFDGKDLSKWESSRGGDAKWEVKDGAMTITRTGNIRTKESFGDCQLHIEWATPSEVTGEGQGRGNSGIFFMSRYEVQVLDSYNNKTYFDGQAGAIYKQHPPLVNASKKPGEWQTYDIIFRAPKFKEDGSVEKPGLLTVFHNGVLVQDHAEIQGTTVNRPGATYEKHPDKQPLELQDHRDPVRYRNIWIRPL